jgi:threonine dehydratase
LIDVAAAAARLAPFASPTPLVRALLLSRDLGCDLWVKNETVSPIASFKWRGALNDLLREPNTRGVVTSSTGNHGQGVAWAAGVVGVPAHIFLPLGANPTKRAKIALLGATIHDGGHDLDAAKETAIAFARDEALRFIDDGESEGVIEGAGTIGLEIARELQRIDVVFVPMGSGSLASGVATAMREQHPHAHIVAVQSSGSPAMVESFHARRAIERPAHTVADGLICRVPAQLALDALIRTVDDAITIPDEELLTAARAMILGAHILVEPSGAAGVAAAMRGDVRGKSVVVIATGANITPELFAQL